MTPEREKYLAGISKEEEDARVLIIFMQESISKIKTLFGQQYSSEELSCHIATGKSHIALLKKHLPAPRKYYLDNWYCPVCGCLHQCGVELYCHKCGQRLKG